VAGVRPRAPTISSGRMQYASTRNGISVVGVCSCAPTSVVHVDGIRHRRARLPTTTLDWAYPPYRANKKAGLGKTCPT